MASPSFSNQNNPLHEDLQHFKDFTNAQFHLINEKMDVFMEKMGEMLGATPPESRNCENPFGGRGNFTKRIPVRDLNGKGLLKTPNYSREGSEGGTEAKRFRDEEVFLEPEETEEDDDDDLRSLKLIFPVYNVGRMWPKPRMNDLGKDYEEIDEEDEYEGPPIYDEDPDCEGPSLYGEAAPEGTPLYDEYDDYEEEEFSQEEPMPSFPTCDEELQCKDTNMGGKLQQVGQLMFNEGTEKGWKGILNNDYGLGNDTMRFRDAFWGTTLSPQWKPSFGQKALVIKNLHQQNVAGAKANEWSWYNEEQEERKELLGLLRLDEFHQLQQNNLVLREGVPQPRMVELKQGAEYSKHVVYRPNQLQDNWRMFPDIWRDNVGEISTHYNAVSDLVEDPKEACDEDKGQPQKCLLEEGRSNYSNIDLTATLPCKILCWGKELNLIERKAQIAITKENWVQEPKCKEKVTLNQYIILLGDSKYFLFKWKMKEKEWALRICIIARLVQHFDSVMFIKEGNGECVRPCTNNKDPNLISWETLSKKSKLYKFGDKIAWKEISRKSSKLYQFEITETRSQFKRKVKFSYQKGTEGLLLDAMVADYVPKHSSIVDEAQLCQPTKLKVSWDPIQWEAAIQKVLHQTSSLLYRFWVIIYDPGGKLKQQQLNIHEDMDELKG